MDLISVIMPFYKKREYFLSSFKSVLSQSYTNIEIIIVYDDNNHDELNWVNSIVSNDKRTIIIDNQKKYWCFSFKKFGNIKIQWQIFCIFRL